MDFDLVGDYNGACELSSTNDPQPHQLQVRYLIKGTEIVPVADPGHREETTWGKLKALYE